MRKSAGITAGLICVAGVGLGLVAGGAEAGHRTLAANRQLARRDAIRHLDSLQLPRGAVRLGHEPSGDSGELRPQGALVGSTARADEHGWWRLDGSVDSLIAYLEHHPPAGSAVGEMGSGTSSNGASEQSITFAWPSVPGRLGERLLTVVLTALSAGGSGVLGEAETVYIVPRTPAEAIPGRTRAVEILAGPPGGRPTFDRTVTMGAKVRRIVRTFNAMAISQPSVISCPAEGLQGAREIGVIFRSRAGGHALARTTYDDYAPAAAPSDACKPIRFTIGGHAEPSLIGGDFVKRLDALLHAHLTRG